MNNVAVTTAAIISFCEELEDASAAFYEHLAERWPANRETYLSFARDDKKNKSQVIRTYQETVSDAYETAFAFEELDLGAFKVETEIGTNAREVDGLNAAITLEETACEFYLSVAARSEGLLATIPRAFRRVAKKRCRRTEALKALLDEAGASG